LVVRRQKGGQKRGTQREEIRVMKRQRNGRDLEIEQIYAVSAEQSKCFGE
jgi:hypothetical protein